MSYRSTSFLGRAGEFHVMAELLERGWNVASPDVDVGEYVLASRLDESETRRVQVQTSRATEREYGYSTTYYVDEQRLQTVREGPADYVFVVRVDSGWGPLVVLGQRELLEIAEDGMGSVTEGTRSFYVRYHLGDAGVEKVLCSDSELTEYLGDLSRWERIEH